MADDGAKSRKTSNRLVGFRNKRRPTHFVLAGSDEHSNCCDLRGTWTNQRTFKVTQQRPKWKLLNISDISRYQIRTNPSFFETPSTTELFSSPASCRQSSSHWSGVFPIETGESCPVNQYYYSGFVALQTLLDYTKIKVGISFPPLASSKFDSFSWKLEDPISRCHNCSWICSQRKLLLAIGWWLSEC